MNGLRIADCRLQIGGRSGGRAQASPKPTIGDVLAWLCCLLLTFIASLPGEAQSSIRNPQSAIVERVPDLEAAQARMSAVSPKTVVVLFDISGSMEKNDTLVNAREATIKLLRGAVRPGDRVVLTAFDVAPTQLVDQRIGGDADLDAVIDKVPGRVSLKQGTNIRWTHHRALRMLEKNPPPHSYVVVVTDSFNDPPSADDPHKADYLKYYNPKSLMRYPDTPENRDYERLLAKRNQLRVETLGVGVLIDEDTGRPREQWAAPPKVAAQPPAAEEPVRNEPPPSSFNPWWLVAIVALVALALFALAVVRPMLSPEDVVLVEGARQAGPFRMASGSVVELGGSAHGGGAFGVPIPGTAAPVAYVRRAGSTYRLELAPASEGAAPEVRVNGEAVQKAHLLRFADEIQVRVPRPEGARAVRFSFERYNAAAHAESMV
jgi:VWA domain-containing protein